MEIASVEMSTCNGLQIHSCRVEIFGGLDVGSRTQIPPVLPLPLVPQVVDGDGGIWVAGCNTFQDLQLVGLLDVLDAPLCFLLAHLCLCMPDEHERD